MRQFSLTIPRFHRTLNLTVWMILVYVIFVAASIGFVKLAGEVHEQETLGIDNAILHWVHSAASPLLDTLVPHITNVGGPLGTVILTTLITGLFLWKRQVRRGLLIFLAVAGATVLNVILKAFFERPRPDLWDRLVVEHSYSFPSGHAMASAALGLALIAALWTSRYRWLAVVAGLSYMLIISATRLYLGVHYPSDVVAGWLVSAAWAAVVAATLYTRFAKGSIAENT